MFIKTQPGECVPMHASPDSFSRIAANIPHASVVEASFFDGLWYLTKWKGQIGFVSAINLSTVDPCPMRWAERYGEGAATILQENDSHPETAALQEDLNLFFYPFSPQVAVDGHYGQQTRAAVLRFQFIRGLRQDGIADMETKRPLYYATQRMRPSIKTR